jgi:hypothetical protein
MEKDIAIEPFNKLPAPGSLLNKPSYLISLQDNSKTAKGVTIESVKYFISIEKPDLQISFVQTKGVFVNPTLEEQDIVKNYANILTNTNKDLFLEMCFPWHKILCIRSLVFKLKN